MRGEPDELLGDSGGVLPAGNKEGNGLLPVPFAVEEFLGELKAAPAFASSIKDFTCTYTNH